MKYKNTKTGAIINSPSKIAGANWIEVKESNEDDAVNKDVEVQTVEVKEQSDVEVKESSDVGEIPSSKEGDFDGITVKQIKQELDAFGIEYDPRAKKQELYDLMTKGR